MTYKLFLEINKKRDSETVDNYIPDKKNNEGKNPVEKFIINRTNYKKTTRELFKIIKECEFYKTKSVNKEYDIHLKNNFSNYDLLEKIDLFTHTLNVAYEAAIDNKPKNIKSINILLALLHDFGKNQKIKNIYDKSNKKITHEKISAFFIEEFFADQVFEGNGEINKDLLKILSQTIKVQHSSFVATNNSYLYNLRKYDKAAREKELLMLRKRLQK